MDERQLRHRRNLAAEMAFARLMIENHEHAIADIEKDAVIRRGFIDQWRKILADLQKERTDE